MAMELSESVPVCQNNKLAKAAWLSPSVLLELRLQTTRGANMEDNLKNQYGLFYGDEMVRAGQIAEEAM